MTYYVKGIAEGIPGGPEEVFNWSQEELRKYNPFAPCSSQRFDFGTLPGAEEAYEKSLLERQAAYQNGIVSESV